MEKAKISDSIRTFGRRHGKKLRLHQQWLIDNMLPTIIPEPLTINPQNSKVILEIGFGNGEHIMRLAEQNPDDVIIGAEPFINGVAQLLSKITDEKNEIKPEYKNIRIWPDDVKKLIFNFQPLTFSFIYILHPDPWPKARHEKRRLLNTEFIKTLSSFISKDGSVIIGTDHTDYYNWILAQVARTNLLLMPTDTNTIKTKYQRKNMFGSEKTMYLKIVPRSDSNEVI